jgi:SAM-dependent methyltransferase
MAKSSQETLFHTAPKVFGIVYALKGDTISDKRIQLAMDQQNEWVAMRIALGSASRIHRFLTLALYLCQKKTGWVPSLHTVLTVCKFLGPARSWFSYLLRSDQRDTLLAAKTLITQYGGLKHQTLDVGCGLGHLPQQFPEQKDHKWICVDKNFFSLFLAQLYHGRPDITYVCADIEVERLFPEHFFSTVVCLDCFAWIYQKEVFMEQMSRLLTNSGQFIMVNVHEDQPHTLFSGYGITRKEVKEYSTRYFSKHTWHHHHTTDQRPISPASKLNADGYSFVAEK